MEYLKKNIYDNQKMKIIKVLFPKKWGPQKNRFKRNENFATFSNSLATFSSKKQEKVADELEKVAKISHTPSSPTNEKTHHEPISQNIPPMLITDVG